VKAGRLGGLRGGVYLWRQQRAGRSGGHGHLAGSGICNRCRGSAACALHERRMCVAVSLREVALELRDAANMQLSGAQLEDYGGKLLPICQMVEYELVCVNRHDLALAIRTTLICCSFICLCLFFNHTMFRHSYYVVPRRRHIHQHGASRLQTDGGFHLTLRLGLEAVLGGLPCSAARRAIRPQEADGLLCGQLGEGHDFGGTSKNLQGPVAVPSERRWVS
jgi:hypothetical protein